MPEKRMLIIEAEVADKVEKNRGDMSQSEFITFLIDGRLAAKEESPKADYVTREELEGFQQGIKEVLRNFLEFFLSYGLEIGHSPGDAQFKELSQELRTFVSKVKPPA